MLGVTLGLELRGTVEPDCVGTLTEGRTGLTATAGGEVEETGDPGVAGEASFGLPAFVAEVEVFGSMVIRVVRAFRRSYQIDTSLSRISRALNERYRIATTAR